MKTTSTLGLLTLLCASLGFSDGRASPLNRFGSPQAREQAPLVNRGPSVRVRNGTVIGRTNGLVDDFIGIPFAQPPVGQLRLRPPRSFNTSFGTLHLPTIATACPQQPLAIVDTTGLPPEAAEAAAGADQPYTDPQGEDCLTLTVQRPAGTARNSQLPVLLWIYGGGYQVGATSQYNGSRIVQQSVAAGKPIIFVAMNYRASAFGFLASRELQKDGSTNLGLRDQRLAMEYISENIEAFGGDPNNITIWGESAGATSCFDQMLVHGGDNKYRGKSLFKGVIMDSGAIVPALSVDSPSAERVYGYVVQAAGCSKAKNTLECLRSVPYETFFNASNSAPNYLDYGSLRVPYLPRPDPSNDFFSLPLEMAIDEGKFARVPIIAGSQEDEGSRFALQPRNLSTTQDLIDYLAPQYPLASMGDVAGLVESYPDDPAAGSPFRTGDANVLYPQFKRLAAIEGDVVFNLRRREALVSMARWIPSWSYLSTYLHGFPFLGTYHASDVTELFSGAPNVTLANDILAYYLNFVYRGTPNGIGLKHWPQWKPRNRILLNISMSEMSYARDDFREKSFEVLTAHPALFAL